jgi:hypothetical protein
MKHDPNMSLICVHAETDDAHGDCLNDDCGCSCHMEPLVGGIGKVRTHIKPEEEYEEAQ